MLGKSKVKYSPLKFMTIKKMTLKISPQ